ncbi:Ankyrin repeat and MYND domain-containing protein 1 [Fasciola gigantica]|uniref:Ankyrin repeat and MYND domain-containing protein 1 n=1 Tax=Fasciola gigantica TaxID=46835 RepID=A0A504Z325_FASGI|nr:Ankyrin repeat and MYND domain-containing protein 1 [Fasciola gigantica]
MTAVIDRQQLFGALSDQQKHTEKHVHHFTNHIYFGLVKDGLKDGVGECAIGNDEYFAGKFVGGLRTSCGTQQWSSGDTFHGYFHADKRNGWGIYSMKNGERYEGTFFQDKKHGFGLYIWPNGSQYFGTFFLDHRCGYGIQKFSFGAIYEGYFYEDQPEGPGVLWYPNKKTVTADVGYWHHGKLIRLVQTVDSTPGFSWTTQFPEYTFYSTVRGEFVDQDKFDRLKRTISNVQSYYLSRCAIAPGQQVPDLGNCFGDNVPQSLLESGFGALFHELDSMARLPASWQMWDLRSKLFDQPLADVAFRCLLHLTRPHPKEWANWRSAIPQDPVLDSDGPTDVRPALELGSDPKSGFAKCVMTNGSGDESNLIIPIQLCSLRPIREHQAKTNKSQKTENDIEQEFERFQTTSLLVIQNRVTHMSYLQQFIRDSWSRWLSAGPASDLVDEPETMTIEKPVAWSELWRCRIRQARGRNKAHSSLKSGPSEKLGILFLSHCQAGLVEQVKQDILENGLKRTSQCGLDPNIADHRGCFGLLWAVLSWNVELVNVLLDFGANVNQVTDEGLCVLSLCLLYYYRVMEQLNPNRILQSHIIDLGSAKCPTPSDGSVSSKEPVDKDSSARQYVYRAEVAMHLSDASAEDKRVLEEQARLAQFRRVYGVRTRPSKVMTVALPTVVQKSVNLDNSNQIPEQQAVPIRLPTFQRFTNCLTRLTKQLKLDVPVDASGLIKISAQVTRVKTPGPSSRQPTNCTEKLRALGNNYTSKTGVCDLRLVTGRNLITKFSSIKLSISGRMH